MRSRKKKNGAAKNATKVPPTSPEARDEGPRLIPLGPVKNEPRLQRWAELADQALASSKPDGKPKTRRGRP